MTTLEAKPNIRTFCLSVAACNGLLHRYTEQEQLLQYAASAIFADGVDSRDIDALEVWLGTLTEEQRDILADGEESEIEAITASSPLAVGADARVAAILTDAYEAMVEFGA